MITLCADWAYATFKVLERLTRPTQSCASASFCGGVEAHSPSAAAPSAAAEGHPIEPTSELLAAAASEIQNLGRMAYSHPQPWIAAFAAELSDRAGQFRAVGD